METRLPLQSSSDCVSVSSNALSGSQRVTVARQSYGSPQKSSYVSPSFGCPDDLSVHHASSTLVLAFLTERAVVKAILEHLGLPATGPPVMPARASSQPELLAWQEG